MINGRINWDDFKTFMDNNITFNVLINLSDDLDNTVNDLTKCIQNAVRNSTIQTKITTEPDITSPHSESYTRSDNNEQTGDFASLIF